jgi:hypothetical protein
MQRKQTSINITETNGKLKRVTTNTRITQESALARSRRIASQNSTLFRFALSGSIFILFFGLLLGVGTTEYYQDNAQTLQWIDSNGQFIEDSYNLQITISNQTPLDDLNGLTLDEVFFDSNLFDITQFSSAVPPTVRATFDRIQNDFYYWKRGTDNRWISVSDFQGDLTTSNLYYNIEIDTNLTTNYRILNNTGLNGSGIYSGISNGDINAFITVAFNGLNIPVDAEFGIHINGLYINLSVLGITSTKEQLDYWYNIWQENNETRNLDNYYNLGNTVVSNFEGMNDSIFQPALRIYDSLRPQIENVSEGVEMIQEGWRYIFSGKLFTDLWKEIFD